MQKWEYSILECEAHLTKIKSSSEEIIKMSKAKIHYLKKGAIERIFKIDYPQRLEDWRAITKLGDEGWELAGIKSTTGELRRNTLYYFKRPLAE